MIVTGYNDLQETKVKVLKRILLFWCHFKEEIREHYYKRKKEMMKNPINLTMITFYPSKVLKRTVLFFLGHPVNHAVHVLAS